MSDRARQVFAVGICWLPTLVLGISIVVLWDVVSGNITTQWSGGEPTTSAPAWTATSFVAGVCLVCGVMATAGAADATYTTRRWVYFFTFGSACAALFIWFAILSASMVDAQNAPMPNWLLLFPFAIPLGILPWLVAGRGPAEPPASVDIVGGGGVQYRRGT